ncbi:MAG: hypothetical protein KAW12_12915 [Candidatus Aminicenantes bacterium]|nr:hypothetical protein [Candidatus Aminicenantes bacterium]
MSFTDFTQDELDILRSVLDKVIEDSDHEPAMSTYFWYSQGKGNGDYIRSFSDYEFEALKEAFDKIESMEAG